MDLTLGPSSPYGAIIRMHKTLPQPCHIFVDSVDVVSAVNTITATNGAAGGLTRVCGGDGLLGARRRLVALVLKSPVGISGNPIEKGLNGQIALF